MYDVCCGSPYVQVGTKRRVWSISTLHVVVPDQPYPRRNPHPNTNPNPNPLGARGRHSGSAGGRQGQSCHTRIANFTCTCEKRCTYSCEYTCGGPGFLTCYLYSPQYVSSLAPFFAVVFCGLRGSLSSRCILLRALLVDRFVNCLVDSLI